MERPPGCAPGYGWTWRQERGRRENTRTAGNWQGPAGEILVNSTMDRIHRPADGGFGRILQSTRLISECAEYNQLKCRSFFIVPFWHGCCLKANVIWRLDNRCPNDPSINRMETTATYVITSLAVLIIFFPAGRKIIPVESGIANPHIRKIRKHSIHAPRVSSAVSGAVSRQTGGSL